MLNFMTMVYMKILYNFADSMSFYNTMYSYMLGSLLILEIYLLCALL